MGLYERHAPALDNHVVMLKGSGEGDPEVAWHVLMLHRNPSVRRLALAGFSLGMIVYFRGRWARDSSPVEIGAIVFLALVIVGGIWAGTRGGGDGGGGGTGDSYSGGFGGGGGTW